MPVSRIWLPRWSASPVQRGVSGRSVTTIGSGILHPPERGPFRRLPSLGSLFQHLSADLPQGLVDLLLQCGGLDAARGGPGVERDFDLQVGAIAAERQDDAPQE